MHITEHIARRAAPLVSFEITPPKKGHSIQGIFDTVEQLMPFKPAFVTVTYHQQQVAYQDVGGGLLKRIPRRKNPGTVGICAALYNRYGIETMPHIICAGFAKYETEDALIDLHYLGFRNLFVVRGDPAPGMKEFVPEPDGHRFASELVAQIAQMNRGRYLEELDNAVPTDFAIGVAGYPEKHYEAPNPVDDLRHLRHKVEQGAGYIISQMVFSARVFRDFVDRARGVGIKVPIIPGIKPITSVSQLTSVPREFHVDLPEELVERIGRARGRADAFQAGVGFATDLCRRLLKQDVPGLHFFTMGRGQSTAEVLRNL